MAKTYAGYVKREVANEIDWSSIGSGISDMLLEERNARETKKKEIDDASREFSKVLTEAEGSGHTGINQFFLDGANSIQEVRLMQDRLLRSGELRLKDYNVQRQNAIDGTNEMLALVKGYDTKYKEKMERLQSGVSAAQEQYQMEQIEGFSNFQNHRLYVNPTNGQFSIGKTVTGKGGINELSKDPNDFSTMQALKNRLNIKIDKYDWDKNVQQGVDNLAKIVLAKNVGGVKTEEDARQMGESYDTAKADWINSMMTNSTNVGSMLTDWIGGYGFTQDSTEASMDDSKILLVPDPRQKSSGNLVPKLSDAQETAVRERLEREFESRIDKVQTALPPSESDKSRGATGKTYGRIVTSLATMQAGKTLEERVLSASDIAGRDDAIIKIVETPDEILVTRQASTKGAQPVTTPYPRGEATLGFVKGAASGLTGVEDLNTALKNSSLTEGMVAAPITNTTVLFERTTPPKPPSGLVKFDAQLATDFKSSVITDADFADDATVMGKLTPIASKYGVRITNPSSIYGQSLIFSIGEGTNAVTQEIDFSETGREGLLESLKGFIKSNKDATERFLALESDKPNAY
jgi:hypothetical protein